MDARQLNDQLRLAVALAKGYVIKRWAGLTTGELYAMVVKPEEYIQDGAVIVDVFPEGMRYAFHNSIPDYPHSFEAAFGLLEEVNKSRVWGITITNCEDRSWFVSIELPLYNCSGQDMDIRRAICEAYVLWCEKKGQADNG